MEKLVYVISQEASVPGEDLRAALIEKAAPALRAAGASRISVNVNDEHVAAGEVRGQGLLEARSQDPRSGVLRNLVHCTEVAEEAADGRAGAGHAGGRVVGAQRSQVRLQLRRAHGRGRRMTQVPGESEQVTGIGLDRARGHAGLRQQEVQESLNRLLHGP